MPRSGWHHVQAIAGGVCRQQNKSVDLVLVEEKPSPPEKSPQNNVQIKMNAPRMFCILVAGPEISGLTETF